MGETYSFFQLELYYRVYQGWITLSKFNDHALGHRLLYSGEPVREQMFKDEAGRLVMECSLCSTFSKVLEGWKSYRDHYMSCTKRK